VTGMAAHGCDMEGMRQAGANGHDFDQAFN
jgi:hypothetical protein